jgi:hypothetical protein
MDLSSLEALGKVAGIGGIAVGAVVLLVRPLIEQMSTLPKRQRAPTFRLIAIGAFAIGAIGIVVWLGSNLGGHNTTVTGGPCSNTSAGDASGNSVNCGSVPGAAPAKP